MSLKYIKLFEYCIINFYIMQIIMLTMFLLTICFPAKDNCYSIRINYCELNICKNRNGNMQIGVKQKILL